jgi:hypothetical protein
MQSYLERLADLDTTETTNLTTSDNHTNGSTTRRRSPTGQAGVQLDGRVLTLLETSDE